MNGILKRDENKQLKAIAFILGTSESKNIIGFHRAAEEGKYLEILYEMCDFLNDDLNSRYFILDDEAKI